MSTPAIGERAYTRYIKHPAGSTSNPLSNGWAVDAGAVQLYDSNLSHLSYESVRPLVQSLGPGLITTQSSGDKYWNGFSDGTVTPSRTFSGTYQDIPWDRRTSMRFGPFALTADRYVLSSGATGSPTGRIALREINVQVGLTLAAANSAQNVFALLTSTTDPQAIYDGNFITTDSGGSLPQPLTVSVVGTGQQFARGTIRVDLPGDSIPRELWASRAASAFGLQTPVLKAYLWVGWYITNNGAVSNYVDSVSAWEIR